ncbi:MAG: hypothetical protein H6Q14_889 [Bacteroidetes bacterium]|nr:hypothetical protein [Bacteroidota bacterium]
METNFNEKESLRVINEMIAQAQNNFQKGVADPSIFSGYVVAFTAIANFLLLNLLENPILSFHVWWLMIPMVFVSRYIGRKNAIKAQVRTQLERLISTVWTAHLFACITILLVIWSGNRIFNTSYLSVLITPTILIFTGMAQFISAKAIRFKAYYYGSFAYWLGALGCMAVCSVNMWHYQFLILAACSILGLAVPGHILNKKAKEHV